jgi:hypothetical protein
VQNNASVPAKNLVLGLLLDCYSPRPFVQTRCSVNRHFFIFFKTLLTRSDTKILNMNQFKLSCSEAFHS